MRVPWLADEGRVPHISLVFREMWDSTAADRHVFRLLATNVKVRGIPHLAKNERDVGHPRFVARSLPGDESFAGFVLQIGGQLFHRRFHTDAVLGP